MIMTSPGFLLSLLLLVIPALNTATSQKISSNANNSGVSQADSKCHNMYTSNFYAGPNKKIEALLQEVKQELGEMREEIKSTKENKTIGKGGYWMPKHKKRNSHAVVG